MSKYTNLWWCSAKEHEKIMKGNDMSKELRYQWECKPFSSKHIQKPDCKKNKSEGKRSCPEDCKGPVPIDELIEAIPTMSRNEKQRLANYSDGNKCEECHKPVTNKNTTGFCSKCLREKNRKESWNERHGEDERPVQECIFCNAEENERKHFVQAEFDNKIAICDECTIIAMSVLIANEVVPTDEITKSLKDSNGILRKNLAEKNEEIKNLQECIDKKYCIINERNTIIQAKDKEIKSLIKQNSTNEEVIKDLTDGINQHISRCGELGNKVEELERHKKDLEGKLEACEKQIESLLKINSRKGELSTSPPPMQIVNPVLMEKQLIADFTEYPDLFEKLKKMAHRDHRFVEQELIHFVEVVWLNTEEEYQEQC